MVTKSKLFFWCPYDKIQLCSGKSFFFPKVIPFFKNGQNKCPNSEMATDFGKKICHSSTTCEGNFFCHYFHFPLSLCSIKSLKIHQ